MGLKRTYEFRKDAVRIALTSGLNRKQVADDLGVGMSTLRKWVTAHRDTGVVSKEDLGLIHRLWITLQYIINDESVRPSVYEYLAHASKPKEHDNNDDFQRIAGRAAERP